MLKAAEKLLRRFARQTTARKGARDARRLAMDSLRLSEEPPRATAAQPERPRLEEMLHSVVDHVIDGIITIDTTGTIESFNPAAEKIFGYRALEVIGRNVSMLMPEPYYSEHDAYLANYLRTGERKIIGIGREVVGRRQDGSTFPMDLAVSEFTLGNRRLFTGIVRDITERKRLEQELRRGLEERAQAEVRMRAVVNHVVDGIISIDEQGVVSTFNPAAEKIFGYSAAEVVGQNVKMLMPEPDRSRHDSYISNYLRTGQAKIIGIGREVVGRRKDGATFPMELNAKREGNMVVLCVHDSGIGIAPEILPRIFDVFVQADPSLARSQGGLGIGLTLVKRVVEMHGGTIEARSAGTGAGSEFIVRLPALAQSANVLAPETAGAHARVTDARRRRVLVVDDNVDAAESITSILQLSGYDVRCVYDGPSALETAGVYRPDVVVLDIGLPGLDGYEVARRLRAQTSFTRTPILAVTGYGQESDRQRSREAGFDAHLTKPVDPAVLQAFIASGAQR